MIRRRPLRNVPTVPTLITLGNAFCGFLAIGYVLKARAMPEEFGFWIGWAGWCIFFGMVLDAIDGTVARLMKSTSNFGEELDSLSDVITFGVAPAMIVKVVANQQGLLERVGWATSALFLLCAALRLARFNAETTQEEESHLYFKGLPTPAAAGFIAAITIMFSELREHAAMGQEFAGLARALEPLMDGLLYGMPIVAVVLAVLMVSNVRYTHAINKLLRGHQPLQYLVLLVLIVVFAVLFKPFSLPIFFGVYILTGIVGVIKNTLFKRIPAKINGHEVG